MEREGVRQEIIEWRQEGTGQAHLCDCVDLRNCVYWQARSQRLCLLLPFAVSFHYWFPSLFLFPFYVNLSLCSHPYIGSQHQQFLRLDQNPSLCLHLALAPQDWRDGEFAHHRQTRKTSSIQASSRLQTLRTSCILLLSCVALCCWQVSSSSSSSISWQCWTAESESGKLSHNHTALLFLLLFRLNSIFLLHSIVFSIAIFVWSYGHQEMHSPGGGRNLIVSIAIIYCISLDFSYNFVCSPYCWSAFFRLWQDAENRKLLASLLRKNASQVYWLWVLSQFWEKYTGIVSNFLHLF